MTAPEYSVFKIDLTAAGSQVLNQFTGLLRFVDAEDSNGDQDLTAKVAIRLGKADAPTLPLRVSNGVKGRAVSDLTISWAAQSGITATFMLTGSPAEFDVDSDPPSQLILGTAASMFTHGAVTVGTSAEVVVAANTSRKSVTIYNLGTVTIYLGLVGVAVADGLSLPANQGITFTGTTAAISGISGTAGQDVRYLEEG